MVQRAPSWLELMRSTHIINTSGLGVPGRRYSLGEFIGAFRFLAQGKFSYHTLHNPSQPVPWTHQQLLDVSYLLSWINDI